MRKLRTVAAIALCGTLVSGGTVVARPTPQDDAQVLVYYNDLDVSQEVGARKLIFRLETAASQVCGERPDLREMARFAAYRNCTEQAINLAVASAHLPMLSAIYGHPMARVASRK